MKGISALALAICAVHASASDALVFECGGREVSVEAVAPNALRIKAGPQKELPELVFKAARTCKPDLAMEDAGDLISVSAPGISAKISKNTGKMEFFGLDGKPLFSAVSLKQGRLTMDSPQDERLYGLGEFQDGALEIRNLPRRLVQVNTQISWPFMLSSRGYAVFWHNYGLVEFNPCDVEIALSEVSAGKDEMVSVSTGTGEAKEKRSESLFSGAFEVDSAGEYAFMLDSGRVMSRRQHVEIDGKVVYDSKNLWLPPTAGFRVQLEPGRHEVRVTAEKSDRTSLKFRPDRGETVFESPEGNTDYVVFAGNADECIGSFRSLCGETPIPPRWAFGYWHCRERFRTQADLLDNLKGFRERGIPIDVIVQDWQWWTDKTWNSMEWDERRFPDPKAMMDEVHALGARAMLSVWSKAGANCAFANEMKKIDGFVPGSDWIDFSKKEAADLYWKWFRKNILSTGMDAFWLDAPEPENDDLKGRTLAIGRGDDFRNVYPLLVNDTAEKNLRSARPDARPLVLTRCAFPGQTRCGDFVWSGDVGSEWDDLRRQIAAGLGLSAAGYPYWTSDAGGFFRPGGQYFDADYKKRLVRWFEFATFCGAQRIHGFVSDTEPWRYGPETENAIKKYIELRCRLSPYIYSAAAEVRGGSSLMRPLVMDFPGERIDSLSYMFGKSILVSPVAEDAVKAAVRLPAGASWWHQTAKGLLDGENAAVRKSGAVGPEKGGKVVAVDAPLDEIPLFIRAGSILPLAAVERSVAEQKIDELEIRIYPGADGTFVLYEDDGVSLAYERGEFSRIRFTWNDESRSLHVSAREGSYAGMPEKRVFKVVLPGEETQILSYSGLKTFVALMQPR